MRSILPSGANEVISLFKGTSIVSVMAIPELFYQVQVIYGPRLARSADHPDRVPADHRRERHDRALWTAPTGVTGGTGNSTALVGTPDTIAAALLDYYDLGIRIFSARGYDIYDDVIDFGRYVIPLVRSEVAHREQRNAS